VSVLTEVRETEGLYFQGPFWLIGESLSDINRGAFTILAEKYLVRYDGSPVNPIPESQSTHKSIWENKYEEHYSVPYNYYPRGRVVFCNGRLYLNIPEGLNVEAIKRRLLTEFDYRRDFDNVFYKDPTTGGHYSFLLESGAKQSLNEDSQLYKGVFWIVDFDMVENNRQYCFTIPSDADGNPTSDDLDLNAKSGRTYNHEKLWNSLPARMRYGHGFKFYPRGRVEISHGQATVYLNPHINTEDIQEFIKSEFNLTERNGIKKVAFFSDGSDHYKCYFDTEEIK